MSLEFRYAINRDYFFYIARADITFPSYNKPKLILIPYFNVTPVAPVFFARSDPAKSTKKNLAVINPSSN